MNTSNNHSNQAEPQTNHAADNQSNSHTVNPANSNPQLAYENLDLWNKSCDLTLTIYPVIMQLQDCMFKQQISLALLAIPAKIGAGQEFYFYRERYPYLIEAKAALAKFKTLLFIGIKLDFFTEQQANPWLELSTQVAKMLWGYSKYIQEQNDGGAK